MHFRCCFAIIIKHRATRAVRAGQQMNMGAFPSGQWGQTVNLLLNASVVRIHQLPPKRDTYKGVSFFCFACFLRGYRWWIRTARAPRLRPAGQKCPSGAFLGRGLRIHQLPPKKIRNLGCGFFFVLSVGRTPFKQKMCRPKGLHNYFRKRSRPYRYHSGNCGILHGACP